MWAEIKNIGTHCSIKQRMCYVTSCNYLALLYDDLVIVMACLNVYGLVQMPFAESMMLIISLL